MDTPQSIRAEPIQAKPVECVSRIVQTEWSISVELDIDFRSLTAVLETAQNSISSPSTSATAANSTEVVSPSSSPLRAASPHQAEEEEEEEEMNHADNVIAVFSDEEASDGESGSCKENERFQVDTVSEEEDEPQPLPPLAPSKRYTNFYLD